MDTWTFLQHAFDNLKNRKTNIAISRSNLFLVGSLYIAVLILVCSNNDCANVHFEKKMSLFLRYMLFWAISRTRARDEKIPTL